MPKTSLAIVPLPYPADSLAYASGFAQETGFIWLDSGTRREYCGQYDLISAYPSQVLSAQCATDITLTQNDVTRCITPQEAELWCEEQTRPITQEPSDWPVAFSGGLLGYIGYEWNHPKFKLLVENRFVTPLLYLGVYEWALVIDHDQQSAYCVFTHNCCLQLQQQIMQKLTAAVASGEIFKSTDTDGGDLTGKAFYCGDFIAQTPKDNYLRDINTILEFIRAGDCYQVNYSQAFRAKFTGDCFAAYCQLRQGCPGPFSAYIATNQGAILSLSPEQFIQIDTNRQAISRPIKGTAPRNQQAQLDVDLAQQLQSSIKNRAENLMIVDLLRNDFSKNCQPGSVRVPELFGLYSFTNVHHLISTIEGELNNAISHWRFLCDAFPGGSITGAPKKRAMEIIQQLEPHQRHIYCGCIGYWSRNGNTRTNIAIRTLLIEREAITLWGGGGVVADSIAEDEYQESLDKIAIFKAILTGAATPNT